MDEIFQYLSLIPLSADKSTIMKITILTIGTRGDIIPFVALGEGLRKAGHEVTLATHDTFSHLAKEKQLDFATISGDVRQVFETEQVQDTLEKGSKFGQIFFKLTKAAKPSLAQAIRDCYAASQTADLILTSPYLLYVAYFMSPMLQKPIVMASVNPAGPTRSFHNVVMPAPPKWLPFKEAYNRWTHNLVGNIVWKIQRPLLREGWKKTFGDDSIIPRCEPLKRAKPGKYPPLLLFGYSPEILPVPPDWQAYQHVTGYWHLPSPTNWQPSPQLADFLKAGKPPVYIGFGSMSNPKHQQLMQMLIKALRKVGRRGILLGESGKINAADLGNDIFAVDFVPYDWLFPQTATIVHHGGAGTVGAGLRAGVPSIITPFLPDQRFWGYQIHKNGLGPVPIRYEKLKVEKLSEAIKIATTNSEMKRKTKLVGEKMRRENGVLRAVELITEYGQRIGVER